MNDKSLKILEDFNAKLAEVEKHIATLQKVRTHLEFYEAEEKKILVELKALGFNSIEELIQKIQSLESEAEKTISKTLDLTSL